MHQWLPYRTRQVQNTSKFQQTGGGAGEGSAVPACWGRPLKPGAPGRLCESAPRSRRPAPPPSAALEPWCTHHARASFSTTSFWTCAGGTHRAIEPPPRPPPPQKKVSANHAVLEILCLVHRKDVLTSGIKQK